MTNDVNCASDFNANELIYNAYNKNSDNFYNNTKYSIYMYHGFMNNTKIDCKYINLNSINIDFL